MSTSPGWPGWLTRMIAGGILSPVAKAADAHLT